MIFKLNKFYNLQNYKESYKIPRYYIKNNKIYKKNKKFYF